jgi:hypothetical protein
MTLKEFIESLNNFAEQNPEALEMLVVTSKDNEGNGFNIVYYTPQKGSYMNGNFYSLHDYSHYKIDKSETNAVCIN